MTIWCAKEKLLILYLTDKHSKVKLIYTTILIPPLPHDKHTCYESWLNRSQQFIWSPCTFLCSYLCAFFDTVIPHANSSMCLFVHITGKCMCKVGKQTWTRWKDVQAKCYEMTSSCHRSIMRFKSGQTFQTWIPEVRHFNQFSVVCFPEVLSTQKPSKFPYYFCKIT